MSAQPELDRTTATPDDTPEAKRALDRSLLLGVAWTAGMKWGTQLLSWGSTLIIARILAPADYGLFGMAMVYMGFVAPIYDLGLSAAIIQRRDLSDDQIARLGGLSVLYGVGFSALSVLLAAPIADFFGEPAVRWIVRVLAVGYLITSLQMLPRALLARGLEFRKLAWVDGVGALTLTAATLAFALAGLRYRALVYGEIVSALLTTAVALSWRPHRLAWPRHFTSIAGLATYGAHVATARLGSYFYNNADFAIVGRVLGKVALGAYSFGWTMATIPVDRVSSLVGRVIPSVMAIVQEDRQALRRYTLGITEGLSFIALPLSIGLSLTADHFVLAVLGERWRAAIGPMQLLAVYAGFRSLATVLPPILVATGHARRNMQFTLLAIAVLPALFLFAARWGAGAVAAVWLVAFPVVSLPLYVYTFRIMDLSATSYMRAIWPALSATGVMALVVVAIRVTAPTTWPLPLRFGLEVLGGAAAYGGFILLRFRERIEAFRQLLRDVRRVERADANR